MRSLFIWNWFVAAVAVLTAFAGSTLASTWTGSSANWSSNANPGWNGTGVPNAQGATALFPNVTAATTATLTSGNPATVGAIDYNSTGDFGLTITPTAALTLKQDGILNNVTPATITNSNSNTGTSNSIILNTGSIVLADDLLISNTGGSTNTTGAIQIVGTVSGTGSLVLSNVNTGLAQAGSIRFQTGVNTFGGSVIVAKGTTTFNLATSFGNSSNVISLGQSSQGSAALLSTAAITEAHPITVVAGSGGTLTLGTTSTSTPAYSSAITLNDSLNILGANSTSNSLTLSGKITGGGGLVFSTTGRRTTLSNGTNNYSGGTMLSAGTLLVGNASALGSGSLTLNGGTLTNTAAAFVVSNPINVSGDSSVFSNSTSNALTLAGAITGTAKMTSNSTGSSNLFISGNISGFNGTFAIGGSTTNRIRFIGGANNLDGSHVSFVYGTTLAGSTGPNFQFGVTGQFDPLIKLGSVSGNVASTTNHAIFIQGYLGKARLEIGNLNQNDTLNNNIVAGDYGTLINISKIGTGTFSYGATNGRTFGTISVSGGGTYLAGHATALGFNPSPTDVGDGNVLTSPIVHSNDFGTHVTGASKVDLNGFSFNEVITLDGNSSLINSNTSTAATLDNGVAFLTLPVGVNGTGYNNGLISTTISGGGGSGAAALDQISGNNIGLGLTNASINSISGGSGYAVGDLIRITSTGGGMDAVAAVTAVGGTGDITGIDLTNPGSGFTTAPTAITKLTGAGSGTVTLTANATNYTVGALKLTASGSGYTSAPTVTISTAGTGSGAAAAAVLSELKLAGDANVGGAGALRINAVVSGVGTLTKVGAGATTLRGANTYTGDTVVSAGTLALDGNGSIAFSPVIQVNSGAVLNVSGVTSGANYDGTRFTVLTGQTLKGNGSIVGNMSLTGGTLTPGASIGRLDVTGSVTLIAGAFDWEFSAGPPPITSAPAGADVLNVSGALAITSLTNITGTNLGGAILTGTKFVAISYGGTISGAFGNAPIDDTYVMLDGKQFLINYDDTNFTLAVNANQALYSKAVTLTAVPEASSLLVMGLGSVFAVGVAWLRKRVVATN